MSKKKALGHGEAAIYRDALEKLRRASTQPASGSMGLVLAAVRYVAEDALAEGDAVRARAASAGLAS